MDTRTALDALNALAHDTRLAAFRALVQAGPDGLSVGELRAAGMVGDEREGRVIRVRADYSRMDALLGYLTENCCAGAADCGPASSCVPKKKDSKR